MNTTPSDSFDSGRSGDAGSPSWGTPTSTPPVGSGSEPGPGPAPEQPSPAGAPGARFFDAVRSLGVVRPDDDRWAAGVAAGLARRWRVAPAVVRIGFVALTLLGGMGPVLYGLAWLLLPHPDGRIHAQQVLTGKVTAGFVGGLVLVLCGGPDRHFPIVPLAMVGLIAWMILGHRRSRWHG